MYLRTFGKYLGGKTGFFLLLVRKDDVVGWMGMGANTSKSKVPKFSLSVMFVCTIKKTANRPNLLILLNFLVSCLFCCCWKNPNLLKNDNDVGAPRYW